MIPSNLNSETPITQIEIQNEIKTTEIKKPVNKTTYSVKYSDLLRQEIIKGCDNNAELSINIQEDIAHSNGQKCGKLCKCGKGDSNVTREGLSFDSKKPGIYATNYWVQYAARDGAPLSYAPGRNAFIAKVFSITFVLLAVTVIFTTAVVLSQDLKAYFVDSYIGKTLFLAAVCGITLINYKVMCSPCMFWFPCNILTLVISVVCMTMIAAYVTAIHNTKLVIYALIGTIVTVLACFLLALTRFDFTKFILYLFAAGIALMALTAAVIAGALITGTRIKLLELIILFVGTIFNVVVLITELQLILGGFSKLTGAIKHVCSGATFGRKKKVLITELQLILGGKTVSLSENDYILGAYLLYTSIVDLFLRLLQILGLTLDEDGDLFADLF